MRMFGNRLHQQIRCVADVSQRAKERCAQRERGQFAAVFGNKVGDLQRIVDLEVVESKRRREKGEIGRRVIE